MEYFTKINGVKLSKILRYWNLDSIYENVSLYRIFRIDISQFQFDMSKFQFDMSKFWFDMSKCRLISRNITPIDNLTYHDISNCLLAIYRLITNLNTFSQITLTTLSRDRLFAGLLVWWSTRRVNKFYPSLPNIVKK